MTANSGLDGVVAADTVLGHTDGNTGTIRVRGHTIDDLVAQHGYAFTRCSRSGVLDRTLSRLARQCDGAAESRPGDPPGVA